MCLWAVLWWECIGNVGGCDDAMKVFDFMPETNSVLWNSMICVFSGKKTEREKETQTNLRVFCPKYFSM